MTVIGPEVSLVRRPVVVAVAQLGPDGQPARPEATVPPKHVEPPSTETEMLRNVEHLHGLVQAPDLGLLVDDQVDVHVGVDKVPVGGPAHRALDAHQAVLLGPAEHRPRVQDAPVLVPRVCSDPANVLAPPEAPVLKAEAAQVQPVTAAAPEEHKAPTGTDLA